LKNANCKLEEAPGYHRAATLPGNLKFAFFNFQFSMSGSLRKRIQGWRSIDDPTDLKGY